MTRFIPKNESVSDTFTGLVWTKNASLSEFPMTWQEALGFVQDLNRREYDGCKDWKLPNRREFFSLVSHHAINPSLPADHPFENVFNGYYWTSTTCDRLPDQAWYIHLGGARVFKGMKHGSYMVWPVRMAPDQPHLVLATAQTRCFDPSGQGMDCAGSGQDGAFRSGLTVSGRRFVDQGEGLYDTLTQLCWLKPAHCPKDPMNWASAELRVARINQSRSFGKAIWRVPHIVELESLIDLGRHLPAMAMDQDWGDVNPFYWSATTSVYNPDYAWVLYCEDGNVGVGFKPLEEFFLWPVTGTPGPALGYLASPPGSPVPHENATPEKQQGCPEAP